MINFEPITVAVYGTLRYGMGNWAWALDRTSDKVEYLGEDMLEGYRLLAHARGGIPFMVDGLTAETVKVDLFRVMCADVLEDLDSLEGHPDWYRRVKAATLSGVAVETYLFPELNELGTVSAEEVAAHGMCVIPNGDWVSWSTHLPY